MLALPTRNGWMVEWETGETFVNRLGETKYRKNDFYTTDKKKADAKVKEMKSNGFKNVTIMECIF